MAAREHSARHPIGELPRHAIARVIGCDQARLLTELAIENFSDMEHFYLGNGRQVAQSHRGAQRISFTAQMADHADAKRAVGARWLGWVGFRRLIDDAGL